MWRAVGLGVALTGFPCVAMALPAEKATLEIYVEYPTLGVPLVSSAINLANIVGFQRVFIDGTDVGTFEFNQRLMFEVPANSKTLELRIRENKPWNWGETISASNKLNIGKVRTGRISVRCHLGFPNVNSLKCRVADWGN